MRAQLVYSGTLNPSCWDTTKQFVTVRVQIQTHFCDIFDSLIKHTYAVFIIAYTFQHIHSNIYIPTKAESSDVSFETKNKSLSHSQIEIFAIKAGVNIEAITFTSIFTPFPKKMPDPLTARVPIEHIWNGKTIFNTLHHWKNKFWCSLKSYTAYNFWHSLTC